MKTVHVLACAGVALPAAFALLCSGAVVAGLIFLGDGLVPPVGRLTYLSPLDQAYSAPRKRRESSRDTFPDDGRPIPGMARSHDALSPTSPGAPFIPPGGLLEPMQRPLPRPEEVSRHHIDSTVVAFLNGEKEMEWTEVSLVTLHPRDEIRMVLKGNADRYRLVNNVRFHELVRRLRFQGVPFRE